MVVKARWERPDRRRYLTVTAPLFVELGNGVRVRAAEWSLGGLRVTGVGPNVPPAGTTETLKLTLPFQGFEVSLLAVANVTESNARAGAFAAEFVDLGERERNLLCHFLDELVRGSMSPVEDTIQRIDVPVAPLPLEPQTVAELAVAGGSRAGRKASTGLMTALYALLGLVVFGYLGLLLYSNLMRFEVDSARLSVPSDRMLALGEGHVRLMALRPGDSVKSGDVLATVFDNHLEREIELADIAVHEGEAKLAVLQWQTGGDRQRVSPAAARARLESEGIAARVSAAEQEVKRFSMSPRTAVNTLRLEEARKKLLAYQKTAESKQVDLTPFEAQTFLSEQTLEFIRQRHKALISHRDRLAVRAPFDGVLVELPRGDNSSVRKGDVVAVVESRTLPTVTALLSPADVLRVGLGEQARLYVPSSGTFLNARVTLIDRFADAAGGDRAQASHAGGHPASLGWARVELRADEPELLQDRAMYRAGLPVVVQFQRRWAHALVTAMSKTVGETMAAVRVKVGNGAHAAARQE